METSSSRKRGREPDEEGEEEEKTRLKRGEIFHPPPEYLKRVEGIAESAFAQEYQRVGGLDNVESLREKLEETGDMWKTEKTMIAPIVTLVQSSGWGKSRTTCELANLGVFVIYWSFASSGTAYPPSSGPTLLSQSRFMLFCIDYFVSCIEALLQLTSGEDPMDAKKGLATKPISGASGKVRCLRTLAKGKLKVLFVMDKARWFTSHADPTTVAAFVPARRASRVLPENGSVSVMFTDTNRRLNNFVPANKADNDHLQHIVVIQGLDAFSSKDKVKDLVDISLDSTADTRKLEQVQKTYAHRMFGWVKNTEMR
ncbi:hypothetical protein SELMODRAFT_428636 [Selaginella moellendorffii]|uniref:Uncharacterized protein n=1 Tax=Selaginella moellendorffii TaxID=88036 RepID=D8T3I8_SELML|nr:hypothetical protein SELMODRAFT_428636 [Selaginella moellendorffii]